jgi:hypothetical protein
MLCYGWVLARQGRSVAKTPVPTALPAPAWESAYERWHE